MTHKYKGMEILWTSKIDNQIQNVKKTKVPAEQNTKYYKQSAIVMSIGRTATDGVADLWPVPE